MSENVLSLSIVDRIIGSAPYMCQGNFSDRIRYAASLGYNGAELNISNPDLLDLDSIHAVIAETNVKITAFGTGRVYVNEGISLTDEDPAIRKQAMYRLRTFLKIAAEFDSLTIIGCIRGNIKNPHDEERVLGMFAEALTELEQTTPGDNNLFVLEPINRYENNFLCNVADTASFILDNKLKRTKILMDTFHMNIEDPDFVNTILTYGKDTAYVHIADSNRKYPGCGHTDFPAILNAFHQVGFTGPFCAECQANGDLNGSCAAWIQAMNKLLLGEPL